MPENEVMEVGWKWDCGWTKCYREGHEGQTEEFHACPYDEDVNNDPTPACKCCQACEDECAGDV